MTCAACAFENRPLARYCGQCGTSLHALARCPRCSAPTPVEYEYCDSCGLHFSIGSGGTGASAGSAASDLREGGTTAVPVIPAGSATAVALAPEAERSGTRQSPPAAAVTSASPVVETDGVPEDAEPSYIWALAFTDAQARLLTFVGLLVALCGELYLQFMPQSNRVKAVGLICLALGAMLFALGARTTFLPKGLDRAARPRLPALDPLTLLRTNAGSVAAGVGTLAFLTLIVRLYFGSTAASDLVLWGVSIAALAMIFIGDVPQWRPSRRILFEIAGVSLVVLTAIGVNAWDANHWYYSAIGDEYAFLSRANGLLVDGIQRPFAQEGVYGAHPVLGSVFQAGVMRVFGRNHFGWTMSSILSHALAIPAVYLIGRAIGGQAVGLLAAAMFGFCHYLFAFAHLGYNNIMAQAPTAWAMAFFILALRGPRPWLLYAAGVAAGLGFYTFYSARTTLPMLALFLVLLWGVRACLTPRGFRDRLLELWPLVLGAAIAIAPIFAASGMAVITRMFTEVPGGYNADISGPPGQRILTNAWLNLPAYFQNYHAAHFTYGSLLDPLTAALTALGIGLAIRWRANAAALLLLVWAGVSVSITALLSPHPTPVLTRLLFGVPPLALLGALAARQVWEHLSWLSGERARSWAAYGAVAAMLVAVLGLNLYRFWVTTPRMMHLTQDAMVVGALRSGICGPDPARTVLVMRGHGLVRGALNSYRPNLVERDLPRLITHADLKPGEPIRLDNARCVIFGDPNDEPAKRALDDLLRANAGSTTQTFNDLSGRGAVQIFLPAARSAQLRD